MATVAVMPSVRRAFQPLNEARLNHLGNMKNRQNGLVDPALFPPVNGKKRAYEGSDENIDPALLYQNKKNKPSLDDVKPSPIARPKRPIPKNRHTKLGQPKFQATLAPAEVNRVPELKHVPEVERVPEVKKVPKVKVKRHGLMNQRRKPSRIDPPNFSIGSGPGAYPISLDHAIAGTVGAYAPSIGTANNSLPNNGSTPMPYNTVREAWRFEIHEDSKDQEMENLLEHSACRMDISDDEGSANAKNDRGKENIPPIDDMYAPALINTTEPHSRRNMMTDEPRTPLGDLNPSDYYGEGLDADSIFIIPADGEELPLDHPDYKNQPKNDIVEEPTNYWKDLLAAIELSKQVNYAGSYAPVKEEVSDDAAPFDIWESESSKAEDEAQGGLESRTGAVSPIAT